MGTFSISWVAVLLKPVLAGSTPPVLILYVSLIEGQDWRALVYRPRVAPYLIFDRDENEAVKDRITVRLMHCIIVVVVPIVQLADETSFWKQPSVDKNSMKQLTCELWKSHNPGHLYSAC
jgi:hypothetical protein